MSCGPYHSAAVSNLGILYTWGDGLCGKLGHTDQASKPTPQPVEALYVGEVKWVCCGWWHTAAVVMTNEHKGKVWLSPQGCLLCCVTKMLGCKAVFCIVLSGVIMGLISAMT